VARLGGLFGHWRSAQQTHFDTAPVQWSARKCDCGAQLDSKLEPKVDSEEKEELKLEVELELEVEKEEEEALFGGQLCARNSRPSETDSRRLEEL